MNNLASKTNFHRHLQSIDKFNVVSIPQFTLQLSTTFNYELSNLFHPFVNNLIQKLNQSTTLEDFFEPTYLENLQTDISFCYPHSTNQTIDQTLTADKNSQIYVSQTIDKNTKVIAKVHLFNMNIDVSINGPYSIYNWELFFHAPLAIAVHLSKNQRFSDAQRWFHYIFNPSSRNNQLGLKRYWNFLGFRQDDKIQQLNEQLVTLSKPADECNPSELNLQQALMSGYEAIRRNPFQPHAVAVTRPLAYQYYVVMKYLDNLIAWGDSLFRQDTIETINEATQLYVMSANLLGPKPQMTPARGTVKTTTYAKLRDKMDILGNALVELEGQFPFNLYFPYTNKINTEQTRSLFGIGKALYFCIPANDKLLGYWDLVADRLFKIRHCMNIEGVVRQLPLFEPPIDPGMLAQAAAAAGININSIISGLNQPISLVRSPLIIQKALEICSELRGLGNNLLSAIEKQEGEKLSLLRQSHEIKIQTLIQDVRYLQWKEAETATESLLKGRIITLEKYRYYQRLLGEQEEDLALTLERKKLTEENFGEVYNAYIGQYAKSMQLEQYPFLPLKDTKLMLNYNEYHELNELAPSSREQRKSAGLISSGAAALALCPDLGLDLHYWGLGGHTDNITGGQALSTAGRLMADYMTSEATTKDSEASSSSKTASYERRADDWRFQKNIAAKELMQIGEQIISSLIREQINKHEYENQKQQIKNAIEIETVLNTKFTNQELYNWMQRELTNLYHQYYKFAYDIAKKAEVTMKHELMSPEFNNMNFIKFNYWNDGRKGLLSGEMLHYDLKRMEMAYYDFNKREFELTKHISLRQLAPLSLLTLTSTGKCSISIPEWLYDLDCPGHYMRRIKNVSLTIPCVTGPYTNVNCTLTLVNSTLRRSSLLKDGTYSRDGNEDDRFIDYRGVIQSVVTSSAQNDSGLFETNLKEERFLPFEGAGAESTWTLELPSKLRQFDYNTISDVILHVRYTARQGGGLLKDNALKNLQGSLTTADNSNLVCLFNLNNDFPSEWYQFTAPSSTKDFNAKITHSHFPYFVYQKNITINKCLLYSINNHQLQPLPSLASDVLSVTFNNTTGKKEGEISIKSSAIPKVKQNDDSPVFLLLDYSVS